MIDIKSKAGCGASSIKEMGILESEQRLCTFHLSLGTSIWHESPMGPRSHQTTEEYKWRTKYNEMSMHAGSMLSLGVSKIMTVSEKILCMETSL